MKVIAKFTDGGSYTWKGVYVDGRVNWDKPCTYLWEDVDYDNFCKKKYTIEHLTDLLCIIQKDKGCTTIYTNPKYDNIHIDIERGKKRASYVKVRRNIYNNMVDRLDILGRYLNDSNDILSGDIKNRINTCNIIVEKLKVNSHILSKRYEDLLIEFNDLNESGTDLLTKWWKKVWK